MIVQQQKSFRRAGGDHGLLRLEAVVDDIGVVSA